MITDNYLNDAIETIEQAKKELDYEITRLQKQSIDTGNLEHIDRLLKKVDSFLVRIKEAYS
jgi:chromosome condensin MukBEF complex kleisin-like MukF subunit